MTKKKETKPKKETKSPKGKVEKTELPKEIGPAEYIINENQLSDLSRLYYRIAPQITHIERQEGNRDQFDMGMLVKSFRNFVDAYFDLIQEIKNHPTKKS